MKQIAIIAPTASGKTALSISLAHQTNSIILSLDSLAIYKQIDIASAKPTLKERDGIIHFGIDEIYPNKSFDVMKFIEIYKRAKEYASTNNKNVTALSFASLGHILLKRPSTLSVGANLICALEAGSSVFKASLSLFIISLMVFIGRIYTIF